MAHTSRLAAEAHGAATPVDVVEREPRDVNRAQTEVSQAQRHRIVAAPDRSGTCWFSADVDP